MVWFRVYRSVLGFFIKAEIWPNPLRSSWIHQRSTLDLAEYGLKCLTNYWSPKFMETSSGLNFTSFEREDPQLTHQGQVFEGRDPRLTTKAVGSSGGGSAMSKLGRWAGALDIPNRNHEQSLESFSKFLFLSKIMVLLLF